MLNLDRLRQLTIQLDNCSQAFLGKLIEKCAKLHTLSVSTYQSWSKLIHLSSSLCRSSIRSLTVHELLVNLNPYERLRQLFEQLEILSLSVASTEDCYRFLTVLFIGHRSSSIDRLRSVTIKCDFDEPDAIARWLRDNIQRRLSYKCTSSALSLWLWSTREANLIVFVFISNKLDRKRLVTINRSWLLWRLGEIIARGPQACKHLTVICQTFNQLSLPRHVSISDREWEKKRFVFASQSSRSIGGQLCEYPSLLKRERESISPSNHCQSTRIGSNWQQLSFPFMENKLVLDRCDQVLGILVDSIECRRGLSNQSRLLSIDWFQ